MAFSSSHTDLKNAFGRPGSHRKELTSFTTYITLNLSPHQASPACLLLRGDVGAREMVWQNSVLCWHFRMEESVSFIKNKIDRGCPSRRPIIQDRDAKLPVPIFSPASCRQKNKENCGGGTFIYARRLTTIRSSGDYRRVARCRLTA